jgi:hypothetical protein
MTSTPENNSVPRQRSSQGSDAFLICNILFFSNSSYFIISENANGNDGLSTPNEDGNNSINSSIKRLSNDQSSDKDDMRMKRQVKNFLQLLL